MLRNLIDYLNDLSPAGTVLLFVATIGGAFALACHMAT